MSNTDLVQYNGTPEFPSTADVGTNADPYLEPTDTPVITAQSNLTDEAPVAPAMNRIKDLYLGLRAAVVGDFAGAVQKTLRSLKIDLVGGLTHTAPAGTIEADGDITSVLGDLLAPTGAVHVQGSVQTDAGNVYALDPGAIMSVGDLALERTQQTNHSLTFVDTTTGPGGGNPPQVTALPNQLRAKNTPKAALCLEMTVANAVASQEGYGCVFGSFVNLSAPVAAVAGASKGIQIIFNTAFANLEFQVVATGTATAVTGFPLLVTEDKAKRTLNSCVLFFTGFNPLLATFFGLDPTATPVSLCLHAAGQQNT